MKAGWRLIESVVIASAVLMISGCSAHMTPRESSHGLDERDVIALTKAGVGSGVIIQKIRVSRSQFSLETDDIIRLKKQGVDDDVIRTMIGTDEAAKRADLARSYDLYEYWFNYYNTFYPVNLYFYPVSPLLTYQSGRFINPNYRWSEDLGRYYREFPVGTSGWLRGRYPENIIAPDEEKK